LAFLEFLATAYASSVLSWKGIPACDLQRLRTINNLHILAIHVRPKETKMTHTQLRRFKGGSLKLPSIFSSSKIPLQYNTSSNKMHHKHGIPTSSKEGSVLWLWFKTRMAVSFPIQFTWLQESRSCPWCSMMGFTYMSLHSSGIRRFDQIYGWSRIWVPERCIVFERHVFVPHRTKWLYPKFGSHCHST